MRSRFIAPSLLTRIAALVALGITLVTFVYLLLEYGRLPGILPVGFTSYGYPNGWQYRTYGRVLMPALVQAAMVAAFGVTTLLLLSRPHGDHERHAPDVRAARVAAEAIALIGLVWIAFQAYTALSLVGVWHRQRAETGALYTILELTGVALTIVVLASANVRFGRPAPRPFVAEHWRFGHLYRNPADPALFGPTRDGSRWTLNFGRPVAAALMALVLTVTVLGPGIVLLSC